MLGKSQDRSGLSEVLCTLLAILLTVVSSRGQAQPMENVHIPSIGPVSSFIAFSPNPVTTFAECQNPSQFPPEALISAPFTILVRVTRTASADAVTITHNVRHYDPSGRATLLQPANRQLNALQTFCFTANVSTVPAGAGRHMWEFLVDGVVVGRAHLDVR